MQPIPPKGLLRDLAYFFRCKRAIKIGVARVFLTPNANKVRDGKSSYSVRPAIQGEHPLFRLIIYTANAYKILVIYTDEILLRGKLMGQP